MKRFGMFMGLFALFAIILLSCVSCTSETPYGKCIGAFDDPQPQLRYKASVKNIVFAIIFGETIVVPVVVILDETRCPVGAK